MPQEGKGQQGWRECLWLIPNPHFSGQHSPVVKASNGHRSSSGLCLGLGIANMAFLGGALRLMGLWACQGSPAQPRLTFIKCPLYVQQGPRGWGYTPVGFAGT